MTWHHPRVVANAKLLAFFDDYARFHRHPKNKLCHYVGIPLIVFTVVGLLAKVKLAVPVMIAVVLYQLTLSIPLTVGFATFLGLCFLLAPSLASGSLWIGFVSGWVLQFVGHYAYEKNSPAFFTNLQQLLVGPLWILGSLTKTPSARKESPGSRPL